MSEARALPVGAALVTWFVTALRMRGMDVGPCTALGYSYSLIGSPRAE